MAGEIIKWVSKLAGPFVGWIGTAFEMLVSEIPNMFIRAFTSSIETAIKNWISGGLSDILGKVGEGLEKLEWLPTWVTGGVENFSEELLGTIDSLATGAVANLAANTSEMLGVIQDQHDFSTTLVNDLDKILGGHLELIKAEETHSEQTGIAITDFWLRALSDRTIGFEELSERYIDASIAARGAEGDDTLVAAGDITKRLFKDLASDLARVEQLGEEDIAAASDVITQIAIERPKMVEEWFMNTVAMPIAYGNNMQWALNSVDMPTDEELKDWAKRMVIIQDEIIVEMAEAEQYTPKSGD